MSESQPTPFNDAYPSMNNSAAPSQNNAAFNPDPLNQFANPANSATPPGIWPQQYYTANPNYPMTNLQQPANYAAPGQYLPYYSPNPNYGNNRLAYPSFNSPLFVPIDVKNARKANLWQRFGVLAFNVVICSIIFCIISFVWAIAAFALFPSDTILTDIKIQFGVSFWAGVLVLLIGFGIVSTIQLGRKGQTLGHSSLDVLCVNAEGRRPGYVRAFLRWVYVTGGSWLAFMGGITLDEQFSTYSTYNHTQWYWLVLSLAMVAFYLLDFFWVLWDSNRQTLVEKILGIYALDAKRQI